MESDQNFATAATAQAHAQYSHAFSVPDMQHAALTLEFLGCILFCKQVSRGTKI
jgi:hypothetical protein